mgnify:CR=1 FL=1
MGKLSEFESQAANLPWWSRPIVVPGWPYLVMVGIVAIGFTFCSRRPQHWDAIEGQVVDAKTQQPIEGAVVVAAWSLSKWGLTHPIEIGTLMAIEVRTDAAGRYRIPKWGPRDHKEGYLDAKSPQVFIVKAGYQPAMRDGWGGTRGESAPRSEATREPVWQVPAIGLDQPSANRKDFARAGSDCSKSCSARSMKLRDHAKKMCVVSSVSGVTIWVRRSTIFAAASS